MRRIKRADVERRLNLTTDLARKAGVLARTESYELDQTGCDGVPWRIVVATWERADDGTVISHTENDPYPAGTLREIDKMADAIRECAWQVIFHRGSVGKVVD